MGRHAAARVPHDQRPARARPWRRGSPDPVPNSAVKPAVAESTAAPGCGRIGSLARAGRFFAPRGPPSGGPSPRPRSNPGAFFFSGAAPTAYMGMQAALGPPSPLVVEALWSVSSPLTRPREGGNVSPCRRARARRDGEGRWPWARTLRTGYCERKIELKSSSDDSDGSDKLGPAS